jgi:hypothetical protein
MNFTLVTRHPTPQELLQRLFELSPGFRSIWEAPDNLFISDDGSFTVHGVFSQFSGYAREGFGNFDQCTRTSLFRYIEECVNTDIRSSVCVSNAACTCFLENLAGDGALSEEIRRHLGPEYRRYYDELN